MLAYKTLLDIIYRNSIYISASKTEEHQRNMACCVVYDLIQNEYANNPNVSANDLAKKYITVTYQEIAGMKNKVIAYDLMKRYSMYLSKPFTQYTISEIQQMNDYFSIKIYIQEFSIASCRPEQYGLYQVTAQEQIYLRNVHEKVMCPIIRFFMSTYGIKQNAMKILDAKGESNKPGKQIRFYIDGVPSINVYSTLITEQIPFLNEYLYHIDLEGNDVVLTMT